MSRQNIFDQNRDMANNQEELNEVIRRQEDLINQLQQQLQQQQLQQQQLQQEQQQQMQQQQMQQQQIMQQREQQHLMQPQQQQSIQFELLTKPKDVIEQFRRLRPLDKNHNTRSFVRSVESTMELCGNNEQLLKYGLQIVVNEKILGDAGRSVRELDYGAPWIQIKEKIMLGTQPKKTYAEIFNYCRQVKVSNLQELFSCFMNAKYEINEVYQVDIRKPGIYEPTNVDRDLVDLLLEKIDGHVRAHISEDETLQDIVTKYTRLRLLDDRRAIDYRHRKPIDRKGQGNLEKNSPHSSFKKDYQMNLEPNDSNPQKYPRQNGNYGNETSHQDKSRQNYYRTNQQGRYSQRNNMKYSHDIEKSRQSKMSTQTIPNSGQCAMETDNIQQDENFITEAQIHNCP